MSAALSCPVEDRLAIQDLAVAYARAVDTMGDIDGVLAVFAEDAVFDLSAIGLDPLHGHERIRAFYEAVFAANAHHAHHLSNFALTAYDGDSGALTCHVHGIGVARDGGRVTVHGRYHFAVARTAAGWKATHYALDLLLPIESTPGSPA